MKMVARLVAAAVLAVSAGPALAHPPPLGIPGFFGGVLHPLFVPAHLMAIVALGLLIGQQAGRWGRVVPAEFVAALIAGLVALTFGIAPRDADVVALTLAAACGLMSAFGRSLPQLVGYVLAALIGFAVALDSPPDVISVREANLMLIGTGLGATVLLIAVTEASLRLARQWQRIAVRTCGSWIAASAILVLALRLAG